MYNRYIPGTNGAYQRSVIQESRSEPGPCIPKPPISVPKSDDTCAIPLKEQPVVNRKSAGIDLGDLLLLCVVLLILLDCEQEDTLPILLTAAAFLF